MNMTKVCKKCGVEKALEEFAVDSNGKFGRKGRCKECQNVYAREYRQKNKAKCYEREKEYKKNNKEKVATYPSKKKFPLYTKKYKDRLIAGQVERTTIEEKRCYRCETVKNIEEFVKDKYSKDGHAYKCKQCSNESRRNYRSAEENKEKIRKYDRERIHNNPVIRLRKNISRVISGALKKENSSKFGYSCAEYFSYSVEQLKEHLEKQFEPWMSWENYGKASTSERTWNIDHITPQSLLPYDSMEHENFKKCWALENLRPLEGRENSAKGNRVQT